MSTFVHGIGASENIDSSGEIVSIAGLDISTLEYDGILNWEHKADQPGQVVGKVLKARKIFSDADCEDDHQLYFWNKVKVPYLYVMGELMDDYKDSAREVAGQFRYDADRKGKQKATANFSVEGSKISKEGITVSRSIARKITITVLECNKAANAEMVVVKPPNPKKSAIDELFKTEVIEIEVFKPNSKFLDLLKKEKMNKDMAGGQSSNSASTALSGVGPTSSGGIIGGESMTRSENDMKKAGLSLAKPAEHARGGRIGVTSTGKTVHSHGMIGNYDFSHKEHREAAGFHQRAASNAKDEHSKLHHTNKFRLHEAAAHSAEKKATKATMNPKAPNAHTIPPTHPRPKGLHDSDMSKAMTAGSGICSPDRLEGGAALAKESAADEQDKNDVQGLEKGGAFSGNVPKDKKIKDLQQKIDSGTYKPDPKKIADKMLQHPDKPLKKGHGNLEEGPHSVKGSPDFHTGKPRRHENPKFSHMQPQKGIHKPESGGSLGESGSSVGAHKKVLGDLKAMPKPNLPKSEMLQRAESDYASWEKREQFEAFMHKRMPNLTKSEISVIGQVMLLQKNIEMEKALAKVAPLDFQNSVMNKSEWKHHKNPSFVAKKWPHSEHHSITTPGDKHGHMASITRKDKGSDYTIEVNRVHHSTGDHEGIHTSTHPGHDLEGAKVKAHSIISKDKK